MDIQENHCQKMVVDRALWMCQLLGIRRNRRAQDCVLWEMTRVGMPFKAQEHKIFV